MGCEACHGPGEQHLKLAQHDKLKDAANGGFPTALAQRGEWAFPTGAASPDARRHCSPGPRWTAAAAAMLAAAPWATTTTAPICWIRIACPCPSGRCTTTTARSSMKSMSTALSCRARCTRPAWCAATATNPTASLRAPGNGVCAQCHKPARYDTNSTTITRRLQRRCLRQLPYGRDYLHGRGPAPRPQHAHTATRSQRGDGHTQRLQPVPPGPGCALGAGCPAPVGRAVPGYRQPPGPGLASVRPGGHARRARPGTTGQRPERSAHLARHGHGGAGTGRRA